LLNSSQSSYKSESSYSKKNADCLINDETALLSMNSVMNCYGLYPLVGWLVGQSGGWLVGWSIGWLVNL
jgi:hypothetical protein